MVALIRLALTIAALLLCGIVIVTHGVRGVILLIVVALAMSAPQTRIWKGVERLLVRLTGSRRRAVLLVMLLGIGAVAVANLYPLVR